MTLVVEWIKDKVKAADSLVDSMLVGIATLMDTPVTVEYPDVKPKLPERSRMKLFNNIKDCTGCSRCARACPIDCIYVETIKAEETDDPEKARK